MLIILGVRIFFFSFVLPTNHVVILPVLLLFKTLYSWIIPFSASGMFKLMLQFTEDYPYKPPTVRFVSRMFHPNSKFTNTIVHKMLCIMARQFLPSYMPENKLIWWCEILLLTRWQGALSTWQTISWAAFIFLLYNQSVNQLLSLCCTGQGDWEHVER